jgi:chromosome segregation ATPase
MSAIADATDSSTVEKLAQAVADLRETVERLEKENQELREELAEHKDHTGREFADVRGRITDVEDDVDAAVVTDTTATETTETPLERICSLPEHVADRELTANQERARFIARDVHDYAENVPAGLVVDSRAIKRVLTASEGKRPHTQTVARVMDFLDDLGKDAVKLIKRRGRKLVVFDPDAADRLANHDRCDRGGGPNLTEDVIGPA